MILKKNSKQFIHTLPSQHVCFKVIKTLINSPGLVTKTLRHHVMCNIFFKLMCSCFMLNPSFSQFFHYHQSHHCVQFASFFFSFSLFAYSLVQLSLLFAVEFFFAAHSSIVTFASLFNYRHSFTLFCL